MPDAFLLSPWGGVWWLLAGLISLTIHECSHALTATLLGDSTPKHDGRVTLFPFPHIDPLGFFLILFFGFGWAKPVLFQPDNLRFKKFGRTMVALAGPTSNALLILAAIVLGRIVLHASPADWSTDVTIFFQALILLNTVLFFANLLPFPPFDGSKFLLDALALLKWHHAEEIIGRYGPYVWLAILALDNLTGLQLMSRGLSFLTSFTSSLLA